MPPGTKRPESVQSGRLAVRLVRAAPVVRGGFFAQDRLTPDEETDLQEAPGGLLMQGRWLPTPKRPPDVAVMVVLREVTRVNPTYKKNEEMSKLNRPDWAELTRLGRSERNGSLGGYRWYFDASGFVRITCLDFPVPARHEPPIVTSYILWRGVTARANSCNHPDPPVQANQNPVSNSGVTGPGRFLQVLAGFRKLSQIFLDPRG
ncbi:hypothetical protein CRG98_035246 [Punica granatum]|uniref:Uncharacterized protein n=1 Tax=Punica granatum TaxID=22663 RepID=A0A2I0IKZ2_PUNGR|nr:hypothetical protein CRG98_035246 [Punica granatum]